ncbi:hypothetical protein DENIS_4409 [Desulfonema ishimotonii]|uniref:Zinc finger/thioredoxin putative domain-containing protein n=1 Tax=Desulfonema ishimotonii TaxID=45657 RepID=A0A401G2R2_9BACT|nr:hypothetical protein [Desulfonema ishimotonii]GBC63415.1 hypothetical protein DENIS_4409 [Desulfonema ishimotonii]
MNIVCKHCKRKIKIPDEKVPKGKAFSIPCPNCKNKISVKNGEGAKKAAAPQKKPAPPPPEPKKKPAAQATAPEPVSENDLHGADDSDDGGDNPFDFLEKGTQTGIICEPDPQRRAQIRAILEEMKYVLAESTSPRDALKQMRYHDFHLIVLNEMFGTRDPDMNHVLKYLCQMPMVSRRNMFVALLSDRFRTGDNMQAFNKSVNLIINTGEMGRFQKVLEHSVKENESFYKVYKDLLEELKGA